MPPKKPLTKGEQKRVNRALEAYAICGDVKTAARLVGAGLNNVMRALSDPDGISRLQKHLEKQNPGDLLVLSVEQRKSLLTKAIIGGVFPRVVFNMETGEPTTEMALEPLTPSQRFKLLDMLNKMEGVYIEKKEIIDKTPRNGLPPHIKNKLNEIYKDVEAHNQHIEEDIRRAEEDLIDIEEIDPLA